MESDYNIDLSDLRKAYMKDSLSKKNVLSNPIDQFSVWFDYARKTLPTEANAMTLTTVDTNSKPSARIVLLKGYSRDGFIFYTNYKSKKGRQISENPYVSLLFFWEFLERQVRIEGIASILDVHQSDVYFDSRPLDSQKGATISPQSQVISSRNVLEEKMEDMSGISKLSRPAYWGGYLIKPTYVEFWQGRPSRLHDRIAYTLESTTKDVWKIERLAP